MGAATEFLYTGVNPIQTGVASGTIDAKRVAVLKGAVKKRDGSPLSGVEITILDHAELGRTLSRVDGAFDLAVNGGGLLTVNYKREGFLPVQRQANAPWQDYEMVDDVVMIPLDTAVTTIDFSTPMQVARGSMVTDADGTRRATIMFPQGTQATMVMPNGSTQPLPTIDVRVTEYTVGSSGPKAMPGMLPPTSGYTWAAELSVDEAIAAGAKSVEFDRAVPVYVENFVGFPAGTRRDHRRAATDCVSLLGWADPMADASDPLLPARRKLARQTGSEEAEAHTQSDRQKISVGMRVCDRVHDTGAWRRSRAHRCSLRALLPKQPSCWVQGSMESLHSTHG
jgi:hypothetical protein